MKSLVFSVAFLATLLTSCTTTPSHSKETANVERIDGVLVFVHAEPRAAYEVVGRLKHDAIEEIASEASNKKLGEALGDMFSKTTENLSLREQLNKMTNLAKSQYPEAEALIINDKVFEAQVISFR